MYVISDTYLQVQMIALNLEYFCSKFENVKVKLPYYKINNLPVNSLCKNKLMMMISTISSIRDSRMNLLLL